MEGELVQISLPCQQGGEEGELPEGELGRQPWGFCKILLIAMGPNFDCEARKVEHLMSMRKKDAFTLIELLTVIAVIAILAAISFGITSGVYQRQARTKAAAELSALSAALESYRAQYGTYPITSDSEVLLQALANRIKWTDADTRESLSERKAFIDPSKFDVSGFDDSGEFGATGQSLVDPWGNEYYYEFSTDGGWQRFGFILFSKGPDGAFSTPTSGIIDKDAAGNADNIYAGS